MVQENFDSPLKQLKSQKELKNVRKNIMYHAGY